MGVENIFYSLDKSKVKVIEGDVPAGFWTLTGAALVKAPDLMCCRTDSVEADVLPIDLDGKILKLDFKNVKETNPAGSVAGAGLGAVVGFRFLGPVGMVGGAIAGHLLSGNRTEVNVTCELADGRRFTAVMSPQTFERFQVISHRTAV